MARRNKVEHFPHPVREGDAMFFIESKYKNDGYATWYKILQKLGRSENHFIDLSERKKILELTARCRVNQEILFEIIDDLAGFGEFDEFLWKEKKIIFNEKFIKSIKEAYKYRSVKCINIQELCAILNIKHPKCSEQKPGIEKEESKPKKKTFIPPTLEEVKKYFDDNGYNEETAIKYFKYYSTGDWHDSNDKPVKNWKQKAQSVWFKDENLKAGKKTNKIHQSSYD